jgi:transposase
MRDKDLYARILGLTDPWFVEDVTLKEACNEVRISVGMRGPIVLVCPICQGQMTRHDSRKRQWRHLDTCQYRTILEADVPRGRCEEHGVKQISVPWAEDRSRFTALFERLVIDWLMEAGQTPVARRMDLTWDEVHGIMNRAVRRGLERREATPVRKIGVDEKSFLKRHEYVTVVSNLETGEVLFVGEGRRKESLDAFYRSLTPAQLEAIEVVVMDMSESYIQSTVENVPAAWDKIVFDKFHISKHLNDAVDKVRRQEHKQLQADGESVLKGTRYSWLKGSAKFTPGAWKSFKELRDSDLRTARAWAIKENFQNFWGYVYKGAAERFFDKWYAWAIRSKIEPMKRVARMLRKRIYNILTYLEHRVTNAISEGVNSIIQWIKYTARGFRNRENFKTAILFHLGGLDLYPHEIL